MKYICFFYSSKILITHPHSKFISRINLSKTKLLLLFLFNLIVNLSLYFMSLDKKVHDQINRVERINSVLKKDQKKM